MVNSVCDGNIKENIYKIKAIKTKSRLWCQNNINLLSSRIHCLKYYEAPLDQGVN